MKFCTKCGKELFDEAEICIGCGCMIEGAHRQKQKIKVRKKADAATLMNIVTILNFIFTIAVTLCMFFLLFSVCSASVSTSTTVSSKYYSYSGYSFSASSVSYYIVDEVLAIWAFIFSCIALPLSIISLVFGAVKRLDKKELFSSISRVTIGVFLWIISLMFIVW